MAQNDGLLFFQGLVASFLGYLAFQGSKCCHERLTAPRGPCSAGCYRQKEATWRLFGDLVSRLSKGPYWASYGL